MIREEYFSQKTNKTLCYTERDVTEFSNIFNEKLAEHNKGLEDQAIPEKHPRNPSWFGTEIKKLQNAIDLVQTGWKQGAERARTMKDDLINDVPAAKSRRRRTVWSDQGDELNVDRAMRGDWDQAWRKAQRQWTNGPSTVEIAAHFGGNCDKTSDQLFWGGAAALVICDILEDAGYNVAISGYQLTNQSARHDGKGDAGWGRNNLSVDKVLIKQAGEPLREDAVASVVCSAGVFRTLGFRAIMGADVFNVDGGLGSTSSWQIAEPMLREAGRWPEEAIKINSVYSRETAIAEIKRVIKMVQDQAATEK